MTSTSSIGPGQVLKVRGHGRWVVTPAGQLVEAGPEQPIAVLAEVESVFFLYGHGLTLLSRVD